MIESFIIATLVGVVEVGPGICQMDLLDQDRESIHTSYVSCEAVLPDYEPIQ